MKNIDWEEVLRRVEYEGLDAAEIVNEIEMEKIFREEYLEYIAEYSDGNIDYSDFV